VKIKKRQDREDVLIMRCQLLAMVITGVVLSFVSSCAMVPSQPPAPGEMRLTKMGVLRDVPVNEGLSYTVEIGFESNVGLNIKRACCSWSRGEEPRCLSDIMDLVFGPHGSFDVRLPGLSRGSYRVECYVEYTQGPETKRTNVVGANISVGR
jgi:hypothetical protein